MNDAELITLYSKVTPYYPISARHRQFLEELPRDRLVEYVAGSMLRTGSFRGPANTRERILFLKRMEDPEEAKRIRNEIRKHVEKACGPEGFIVGTCPDPDLEGKSLLEISEMTGKSYEDVAIELALMGAKAVPMQMSEEDIEYIMQKDYVGTGSDGTTPFFGVGLPHVRSYSTFLHKIKEYGLNRQVVSIPHIIRSQTSLPAEIMDWKDRGSIKRSYRADIVIFDMDDIHVESTISRPHQYAEGVRYLLINGQMVIDEGAWNGSMAGEVLLLNQ
jgi:N-acyl-D-aspartate/D-glutamate deacylase